MSGEDPRMPLAAPQNPHTPGWGAFAVPEAGEDSEEALSRLEAATRVRLGVHRIFRVWDDLGRPDPVVTRTLSKGRVPIVSWRPGTQAGARVPWTDIAAGLHDQRIRQTADWARCQPGTIIAVLHHEPELAKGYGRPGDYRAAFAHWRGIFDQRAADNVRHAVVCSPAAYSSAGARAAELWPAAGVDYAGVNAYNWAGCSAGQDSHWVPLGNVCRSAVAWARREEKPLIVAEWGCVEDQADPARKAAWITAAGEWVAGTPEVAAMSYLHAAGSCPWWLDSSPAALAAYTAAGVTAGAALAGRLT
jgi:hypothetical protein